MRLLAESLRRLYRAGKIDEKKVKEMAAEGKITMEEMEYIVGEG